MNSLKFFKFNRLLNKRIVKKDKEQVIEYVVRSTDYSSKWNR